MSSVTVTPEAIHKYLQPHHLRLALQRPSNTNIFTDAISKQLSDAKIGMHYLTAKIASRGVYVDHRFELVGTASDSMDRLHILYSNLISNEKLYRSNDIAISLTTRYRPIKWLNNDKVLIHDFTVTVKKNKNPDFQLHALSHLKRIIQTELEWII